MTDKNMTWEQLILTLCPSCDNAKNILEYRIIIDGVITIRADGKLNIMKGAGYVCFENRTPYQMHQIITALTEKAGGE